MPGVGVGSSPLSPGRDMPGLLGADRGGLELHGGPASHHVPHRGSDGVPHLGAGAGSGDAGPDVLGRCGLWVAGTLDTVSQPDPHGVVAPRAYLEVYQLELEKLSTQIRESKRNSRLVSVAWEEPYVEWCFGQTAGVVGIAHVSQGRACFCGDVRGQPGLWCWAARGSCPTVMHSPALAGCCMSLPTCYGWWVRCAGSPWVGRSGFVLHLIPLLSPPGLSLRPG